MYAAFEKVVNYRGQEYLTQLIDTAGQVRATHCILADFSFHIYC